VKYAVVIFESSEEKNISPGLSNCANNGEIEKLKRREKRSLDFFIRAWFVIAD